MKNYPTILLAAEALKRDDFSFVNVANIVTISTEISDFCDDASEEYIVRCSLDGYWDCLNEHQDFFSALAVIAEKMPLLLRNENLKEFLGYMYQQRGAYFKGMIAVLEACQVKKDYLSAFARFHVSYPEVRSWIKSNRNFCHSYWDEILAEMKRGQVFDTSLSLMCKTFRLWTPMNCFYLCLGVLISVWGVFFYLTIK